MKPTHCDVMYSIRGTFVNEISIFVFVRDSKTNATLRPGEESSMTSIASLSYRP